MITTFVFAWKNRLGNSVMNVLKLATAAAAVATLALAATPSLAATTWDAVADFSSTQSTVVNGVWSYGWDAGTGFQAYTTNTACGTGLIPTAAEADSGIPLSGEQ